jgi:hypothetical protein
MVFMAYVQSSEAAREAEHFSEAGDQLSKRLCQEEFLRDGSKGCAQGILCLMCDFKVSLVDKRFKPFGYVSFKIVYEKIT